MATILSALFLLALAAILPLYAMYFSALVAFGKDFQQLHPSLYVRFVGPAPPSFFSSNRTYKLFRAIESGKDLGEPLNPALLAAYRRTRKYLLFGLGCFMVLLFSGLAQSILK